MKKDKSGWIVIAIIIIIVIISVIVNSCKKEYTYCWQCEGIVMITSKKVSIPHYAISKYCDRTEEWAKQRERDGTWASVLISSGDTVKYISTTKCSKQ